jgi:hypothetical protein
MFLTDDFHSTSTEATEAEDPDTAVGTTEVAIGDDETLPALDPLLPEMVPDQCETNLPVAETTTDPLPVARLTVLDLALPVGTMIDDDPPLPAETTATAMTETVPTDTPGTDPAAGALLLAPRTTDEAMSLELDETTRLVGEDFCRRSVLTLFSTYSLPVLLRVLTGVLYITVHSCVGPSPSSLVTAYDPHSCIVLYCLLRVSPCRLCHMAINVDWQRRKRKPTYHRQEAIHSQLIDKTEYSRDETERVVSEQD